MDWIEICKNETLRVKSCLDVLSFLVCTCRPGMHQDSINGRNNCRTIVSVIKKQATHSPHHNGLLAQFFNKWSGTVNDQQLCDALLSTVDRMLLSFPDIDKRTTAISLNTVNTSTIPLNTFIKALNGQRFDNSEYFSQFMRPILEALCVGRNDLWIRHGQETKKIVGSDELYPVPGSYWEPTPGFYSIEIGTMPIRNCLLHGSMFQPWGLLNTTKHDGVICPAPYRDHLAANHKVDLCKWLFVFNDFKLKPLDTIVMQRSMGYAHVALVNVFVDVFVMYRNLAVVLNCYG